MSGAQELTSSRIHSSKYARSTYMHVSSCVHTGKPTVLVQEAQHLEPWLELQLSDATRAMSQFQGVCVCADS